MIRGEKALVLYHGSEVSVPLAIDLRSLLVDHKLADIPRGNQWELLKDFLRVRREKVGPLDPRFRSVSQRLEFLSEEERTQLRPCIDAIREATTEESFGISVQDRILPQAERALATPGEDSLVTPW